MSDSLLSLRDLKVTYATSDGPLPAVRGVDLTVERGQIVGVAGEAVYAALKARGKASRVALIAVARKILVLANALIRDMVPYKEPANSVC